ncbi:fimbrillin family protein [Bacteroides uniformis]
MKRYMKFFTGIVFWGILLVCSACTDEYEANNGGMKECCEGVPFTVRAIVADFEELSNAGKSSTRTSVRDEHFKMEFVDGDSIGVFAIKDGAIMDNIDNAKLVYNMSSGSWNPVGNGTLYWYDGVSYVAYYPYRKNITIDLSKGMDGAIASLTGNEKLQPAKDQSTTEKHIVSDLLVATGVPAIDNSSGIILNLLFQHQFALLVLQPQVYVGCFAPEKAGFVYHRESRVLGTDSAAINVSLNGITPYQIDSLKYCAIVPPQANARVTGNYMTTDGRDDTNIKINYSGSSISFTSGKCYTLKVISPVPGKGGIERKLYPGDFVFQNEIDKRIEVHPGNGKLEEDGKIYDYENAIGMVITCDPERMTDERCNKKGWNHAYVMMLDSLKEGNWGPMDLIEADIDTISIADVKSKHDFSRIKNNMNGYSETLQMLANHEGDASFVSDCRAFYLVKTYNNSNKVPDGIERSPWFLPSIGPWFDVLVNICGKSPENFRHNTGNGLQDEKWGLETLDKLKGQLSKVGKSLPQFNVNHRLGFSGSSQYDKDRNWMLLWHIDDPLYKWERVCLQGYNKTSAWHVRPFFAF